MTRRIGLYAGTFDPVHNGHLAFARAAQHAANLETIIFLPERTPRGKQDVTHFAHRVAMLHLALAHDPTMQIKELPDSPFSVNATLPPLKASMGDAKLFLLVGSDVAAHILLWPDIEDLLLDTTIIIGQRQDIEAPILPRAIVVPTDRAHLAASHIRRGQSQDIAPAVGDYIVKHHLYVA